MRYGIFGDIHGNEPALEAVLEALETQSTDRLICLGDIVGYGADAVACMARIREMGIPVVAGNHDWAVAGRLGIEYFNPHAQAAVMWTREALSESDLTWLRELEPEMRVDELTIAHATVHDPDQFDYMTSSYDAYLSFQVMETDVGFVGHSHVPITFFFDGSAVTYAVEPRVALAGRRAIGNPGSVGQPRDEDPRAGFMVYDSTTSTIETHRVAYDIDEAAKRILAAGLPPILAERLRVGR